MTDFVRSLTRHLDDLRTRSYEGFGDREGQLAHFAHVVGWLEPVVTEYLAEANRGLLDSRGTIASSGGVVHAPSGTAWAWWSLTWQELVDANVPPARIATTYFPGWQHPHLHGAFPDAEVPAPELACKGMWPLQVRGPSDVDQRRSVIEALVETELHDKVCTQAFARRLGGLDGNEAWVDVPGYARANAAL